MPFSRRCLTVLAVVAVTLCSGAAARAEEAPSEGRLATTVELMPHYGFSAPTIPNRFYLSVRRTQMVGPPFSGTITVREGDTILAVVAVTAYGTAEPLITLSSSGDHVITADYSGDDNYLPGTGSITQHVISNDALSGVPRPAPPPAPAPEPAPVDPVPAPPAPPEAAPPALAPAVVPKRDVRAGLREVTGFALAARSVSFTQRVAAPGTIAWTVEARGGGTAVLATSTRHVDPGPAAVTLAIAPAARAHLRRHPNARIVLRTELALDDGRALRSSRRLTPIAR